MYYFNRYVMKNIHTEKTTMLVEFLRIPFKIFVQLLLLYSVSAYNSQ